MADDKREIQSYVKLDSRVATLESDVANLVKAVDRVGEAVERLGGRVSQGTNWGVLGTWSAVMISVIGGIGILALLPLRAGIERNEAALTKHEALVAHPAAMGKLGAYDERFRTIQAELNAAMNNRKDMHGRLEDSNANLQSQIDDVKHALDNGLAKRIHGETLDIRTKLDAIEKQLDQHEHMENHPLGVIAKIEALKARVAILEGRGGSPSLEPTHSHSH